MNKGGVFVVGALIGFAVGIFSAPKPGVESRAEAAEFARGLWGTGQEYYQQGAQRFQSAASNIRPNIDQRNDQLQAKIDAARKIISEQVARNAEAARAAAGEERAVETEIAAEAEATMPAETEEKAE